MALKTRQQVRDEFAHKGQSYTAWARQHGYSSSLVIAIISDTDANPRYKCLRGDSHNVAVQLGIKLGEVSRTEPRSRMQLAA